MNRTALIRQCMLGLCTRTSIEKYRELYSGNDGTNCTIDFLDHNLILPFLVVRSCNCVRMSLVSSQHLHILQDMLKDFALGEHLLLVGNQVGWHHVHQ